ncbi:MAG: membrane dipeptidase [Planctomycetota bacterium]|nr:membrane dipeptidase [Planctomycetota bacterium]
MTGRAPSLWFDAHLDLAYLAVTGRDLRAPLATLALPDAPAGPHRPAGVTLPALREGGVHLFLATIFTEVMPPGEPVPPGPEGHASYTFGDADGAYRRARGQLEVYLSLAEGGVLSLDLPRALRAPEGVGEIRGGMGVAEVVPPSIDARVAAATRAGRPLVGILMENADPIRSPADLEWWVERGVCAVGLTWARSSRYATGNGAPPGERVGLTPLGHELVREMDRLGVLHDASHLSDRALEDLFEATPRVVVASHSNCRALLDRDGRPPNQRHLTDRAIREIVRRGGVVGLNLYSPFVSRQGEDRRATIDEAIAHVERVCELAGSMRHVGLGSDIDGGFGADRLPAGIDRPADYRKLAEALARRGWTREQLDDFAWRNWARVLAGDAAP